MIKVTNLQKSFGSFDVLSNVSFSLERGQKVALVGNNGTGKTTLLKILAGLEDFDGGKIEIDRDTCIGYLPQDTSLSTEESIMTYLKRISGIDILEKELESSAGLDDPIKMKTYNEVQNKYEHLSGYSFVHRAEAILSGFGFHEIDLNHSLRNLSSGQKSKVVLAGILLRGVDLLLLDEPTNNLDLPALIWLEDFLRRSDAACIVVSHDRRFLDGVVRKIFELDWSTHTIRITGGTYSDYLQMVAKQLSNQKEMYKTQQEEIERLTERVREKKADAARGSQWSGKDNDKFLRGFKRDRSSKSSKIAKTIEKRINQMDKIEKPIERKSFQIPLDAKANSKILTLRVVNIVAGYPNGFKIGPISLEVRYGERVGIMGLNGSGKSTLLKTITGQLSPVSGEIETDSGIHIGNMMQEHEFLDRRQTLLDFFMEHTQFDVQNTYAKLSKFGFDERQVHLPISALSPGGRARFLFALFSARSVNVLVLDEPTNHLDIEALDALQEALKTYEGSVILVSHDRDFLEKASLDVVYELSDGNLIKIQSLRDYITGIERKAKKLIRLL